MCLAAASYAVGTSWSWRSSLEGSQVAGCALPRIHGTHIYLAALIVYTMILRWRVSRVAHPLITERESLIIGEREGGGEKGMETASRSQSADWFFVRAILQKLLARSVVKSRFNYTATARNINLSVSYERKINS